MQDEVLDFVRGLKPASHSIFCYASPKEKHEVLFTFLQTGFEKGKGAIYIAAQETPNQIRKDMEVFGINVRALEKKGALKIISCNQWYMIDGKFDASKIFALGERELVEATEKGFNGLNVCGEVACLFEHKKERDLINYELMCGRELPVNVTAVCAYDVNHVQLLGTRLLLGLMKAHGFTITSRVANEIKFENLYIDTVEEKLNALLGSSAVQALLWRLEREHSIKKEKIGENPEAFVSYLESVFGPGAEILENAISEGLFSKIGL